MSNTIPITPETTWTFEGPPNTFTVIPNYTPAEWEVFRASVGNEAAADSAWGHYFTCMTFKHADYARVWMDRYIPQPDPL